MQRSVWSGAISFGLIYVPVDVMSASKDASLSLHFLDSRDFSPVGYQRINKSTGMSIGRMELRRSGRESSHPRRTSKPRTVDDSRPQ
jgi:non-homologous end joining protein Ku